MRKKRERGRLPPMPSIVGNRSGSLQSYQHSRAALNWAFSEWFVSYIDASLFSHSEFLEVLCTHMSLSHVLSTPITRAEWARIRCAMCNVFPGGYAKPRRLSNNFLAAELHELQMYRNDVRRVLRNAPLYPANDPTSGVPLSPTWYARYRFPPPTLPPRDAKVLVRTQRAKIIPARFVGVDVTNESKLLVRFFAQHNLSNQTSAAHRPVAADELAHAQPPVAVHDVDVMLAPPSAASSAGATSANALSLAQQSYNQQIHAAQLSCASGAGVGVGPGAPSAGVPSLGVCSRAKDVDVRALATLLRSVERREAALRNLKAANDHAETVCTAASQAAVMEAYNTVMRLRSQDPNVQLFSNPNVTEFDTPAGAAALAKSLAKGVLARMPRAFTAHLGPPSTRADVLECVAACVAVLLRARTTRNPKDVALLLDQVRVKCPQNAPVIADARRAAASLDGTSSESQ